MLKRYFLAAVCLLLATVAMAQFTQAGFYRVHNVNTDSYICIRGTHYEKSTNADAFWSCVLMLQDSVQVSDPGAIIYIPGMVQTSLYAQGVNTYSLTGLKIDVDTSAVREGGLPTYLAKTKYNNYPCYFRDCGFGMTAGFGDKTETRWWIEPVNEGSIDTSFMGVKPVNEAVQDAEGWYWTTMCCDFPFLLPLDGGVEGAYTITEVNMGVDSLYYAEPVKVFGQGDTVSAATPVLLKCKASYASGNKVVPVGQIANHKAMPIVNDLLMGDYFSSFYNHCSLTDTFAITEYVPLQAAMTTPDYLALGVDADGKLGFFQLEDTPYMPANTAWLSIELLDEELQGVTAIYLGSAPEADPDPVDPEPEIILGDVNGDGKVSIKDVTSLIELLLSGDAEAAPDPDPAPDPTTPDLRSLKPEYAAADINQDGRLSIKDVTLLIEMLLSTGGDQGPVEQ